MQFFYKITFTIFISLSIVVNTFGQWQKIDGPYGGEVFDHAVLNDTYFVGTQNGLFKSTDHCETWEKVFISQYISASAERIEEIVSNDTSIYVVTNYSMIYRSYDEGLNWERLKSFHCLMDIDMYDSILVVGKWCSGGVEISTDKGNTFTQTSFTNSTSGVNINEHGIFAKLYDEFLYSVDQGLNWDTLQGEFNVSVRDIEIFSCQERLFAVDGSIKYTPDYGQNWVEVYDIEVFHYVSAAFVIGDTIILGGGNEVFISFDKGDTWLIKEASIDIGKIQEISYIHTELQISTTNGFFISDDLGDNWDRKMNGVYGLVFYDMINQNEKVVVANDKGLAITDDYGLNWDFVNMNEPVKKIKEYGDHWYFTQGDFDDQFFKTDTFGNTIKQIIEYGFYQILDFAITDTKLIVVYDNYYADISITEDEGDTWYLNTDSLPAFDYYSSYSAVTGFNNDIYLSFGSKGIFRLGQADTYWKEINEGLVSHEEYDWYNDSIKNVYSYVLSFQEINNELYCNTNEGIYKFNSNDTIWEYISCGLYEYGESNVRTSTATDSIFIAGTSEGIQFARRDNESHWGAANEGLNLSSSGYLSTLKVSSHNEDIYSIFSNENRIWHRNESDFPLSIDPIIFDHLAEICSGETFQIGDSLFTEEGNYTVVLQSRHGCDSIINLDLIVDPIHNINIIRTLCEGDSIHIGDSVFYQTGNYTVNLTNRCDMDSIINLDLTVNDIDTILLVETICEGETYQLGSYTYSETGIYTHYYYCDSLITLDLTVLPPDTVEFIEVACDSYTGPDGTVYTSSGIYTTVMSNTAGCDSTITIDLTVNESSSSNITVVECESYTAPDGATYTNSGIYTAVIPNAAGCDSTITIDLTINTADASVNVNGNTITAGATDATYQWVDCDNADALIEGETDQSFTATVNGNFAVIITQNDCTDMSVCTTITSVGIEGQNINDKYTLYPNPTTGIINLTSFKNLSALIQITDITGKVLIEKSNLQQNEELDLSRFANGIYIIRIQTEDEVFTSKIVKE